MVMLRASDWTKIKKDWLKGCRLVLKDGGKCNIAVSSVDSAIESLNSIADTVMRGMK